MKSLIKGFTLILSISLLAACGKDDAAPGGADAAAPAPVTTAVAPALPVTVDDLKAAAAKGDDSAADLLRLLDLAEKGEKEGQFQLGAHYRDGLRIKQDYAQAFQWLSKASEQGHPSAHFLLGSMYQSGAHVALDTEKALAYYKKAYKGGYAPAKDMVDTLEAALK